MHHNNIFTRKDNISRKGHKTGHRRLSIDRLEINKPNYADSSRTDVIKNDIKNGSINSGDARLRHANDEADYRSSVYDMDKQNSLQGVSKPNMDICDSLQKQSKPDTDEQNSLQRMNGSGIDRYINLRKVSKSSTEKYNDFKKINKPETDKYNNMQTISKLDIEKYNNFKKISKSDTDKYNGLQKVSKSAINKYNDLQQISKLDTDKYNNMQKVSKLDIENYNDLKKKNRPITDRYISLQKASESNMDEHSNYKKMNKSAVNNYNDLQKASMLDINEQNNYRKVSKSDINKYNELQKTSESNINEHNNDKKINNSNTDECNNLQKANKSDTNETVRDRLLKISGAATDEHVYSNPCKTGNSFYDNIVKDLWSFANKKHTKSQKKKTENECNSTHSTINGSHIENAVISKIKRKLANNITKKEDENISNDRKNQMMHSLLANLKLADDKYGMNVLQEFKSKKRSADVNKYEHITWQSLGLDERVIKGLNALDYKYPSPVQKKVLSIAGKSLVVRAKNGTGKTLAYLLPIINDMVVNENENGSKLQCIVLVPTRELAMQVAKVAKRLMTHIDSSIVIMPSYGGSNVYEDIIRIKGGINGIVSTPGRILDLIERKVLALDNIKNVILDEADKLLSIEYKNTLHSILHSIKCEYNLRLFSATFPLPVNDFVENNMHDVLFVNLMKKSCLLALRQFYCCVKTKYKLHCLITLLRRVNYTQAIIFCNRTKTAELLAYRITELGYTCYYLSGKMTQEERNIIFHSFSNHKINILISTDLTTRGIDVPNINLVINFDWPRTIESYLHRIGRAGRFGTEGISISLVGDDDKREVMRVESALECDLLPVSDPQFTAYCK